MKYHNVKTGGVLDAACEISGGDWELIPDPAAEPADVSKVDQPKTKTKAKKPKE